MLLYKKPHHPDVLHDPEKILLCKEKDSFVPGKRSVRVRKNKKTEKLLFPEKGELKILSIYKGTP